MTGQPKKVMPSFVETVLDSKNDYTCANPLHAYLGRRTGCPMDVLYIGQNFCSTSDRVHLAFIADFLQQIYNTVRNIICVPLHGNRCTRTNVR